MVCEANWKDRLAYATFWMALLAVVAILLGSCNQGAQGKGDGGPPPPPYECEYEEEEYNDTLDEANFVNILPVLGGNHHICGELYHWGQGNDGDVDTFYFFMNPTQGQETLFINFVVESDPQVIPKDRSIAPERVKILSNTTLPKSIWGPFGDRPGRERRSM